MKFFIYTILLFTSFVSNVQAIVIECGKYHIQYNKYPQKLDYAGMKLDIRVTDVRCLKKQNDRVAIHYDVKTVNAVNSKQPLALTVYSERFQQMLAIKISGEKLIVMGHPIRLSFVSNAKLTENINIIDQPASSKNKTFIVFNEIKYTN